MKMIMGIEALALEATDILSVSRAAQQIVTPLAKANSKLVRTSVPVNPDEVKYALDKTSVAIASVDRKMQECVEIIDALNSPEDSGLVFTHDFSAELKERAEILTYQIENLKNVFSMVEDSPSWKPYLATVKDRKLKSIRAISNLRNAYLNIALLAEQFISPVPIVESSVEGSVDEFASAIAASNELLKVKQSEWR